jgi:hypothetical protein
LEHDGRFVFIYFFRLFTIFKLFAQLSAWMEMGMYPFLPLRKIFVLIIWPTWQDRSLLFVRRAHKQSRTSSVPLRAQSFDFQATMPLTGPDKDYDDALRRLGTSSCAGGSMELGKDTDDHWQSNLVMIDLSTSDDEHDWVEEQSQPLEASSSRADPTMYESSGQLERESLFDEAKWAFLVQHVRAASHKPEYVEAVLKDSPVPDGLAAPLNRISRYVGASGWRV